MRVYCSILAAVVIAATGCASSEYAKRPPLTGDAIIDGKNNIQFGPKKDRVLWEYRVALAAMRRGDYAEAKQQLDSAIARIGGIYSTDADAKKARGLFHNEAKKTFIGEPYERVMAYLYRGILYWMDGEPDNARACFRSAQLQDADAEKHEYAADYVLLDYLDGFASVKLNGEAKDEFDRAVKNTRGTSAPPAYNKAANVLVFIEFGNGPKKFATGGHAEQLRFKEEASVSRSVNLRVDTNQYALVPYDDLQWQATTRGGREMDHILANKAVFKDVTKGVAIAGGVTSFMLADPNQIARRGYPGEAALIAGGVAAVAGALTLATKTEADIRAWDNLPRYLTFAPLQFAPGEHNISVEFRDANGRTISTRSVKVTVPSNSTKDTVLFVSEHNT
jgi:tetratricopeptide (TPR) repeat protein